MPRWFGNVGFVIPVKTAPGVWQDGEPEEYPYAGDKLTWRSSYQNQGQVIDDIKIDFTIEIIADPFAYKNFAHIRYVEYLGRKWKVTAADPTNYPRIALTVGGLYECDQD